MKNWRWKETNFFLAATIILLIALTGFYPEALAQEKKVPRGGTLKMIYQEPTHLNMAIVSGTPTGVPGTQIFAGLLQFDEKFQPRPYLATKWEVSPDGREVENRRTRHLRGPNRPAGGLLPGGRFLRAADAP